MANDRKAHVHPDRGTLTARRFCAAIVGLAAVWSASAACCSTAAAAEEKPLWLVVGRAGLVEAVAPLAKRRRAQGFEVVVSTEPVEKALAAAKLRDGRPSRRPAFVLLVGDDQPGKQAEPWYLPARRVQALQRWHAAQARQFASDAAWGDLDDDAVPDVPVGRIPARTREEVALAVGKTLAFERRPATLSDLRMVVWAGAPGYSTVVDRFLISMGMATFRRHAPGWVWPWAILADPTHALCGWPADHPALFVRQLRQGAMLAALIGHGRTTSFFSIRHAGESIRWRTSDVRRQLANGRVAPPVVVIACHCGNFAQPRHCLGEALLFAPGGPAAAIGATAESHPLTNYYSSRALIRSLDGRQRRLGTLWLDAQRLAAKARSFLAERTLRAVESERGMKTDIGKLKRDHLLMYALLGDPATELKLPRPLGLEVERKADGWHWRADKPKGAARLYVDWRRDDWVLMPGQPVLPRQPAREAFGRANALFAFKRIASLDAARPWEGTVGKPGWLRVVAEGPDGLHAAAAKLTAPTTQPKTGGAKAARHTGAPAANRLAAAPQNEGTDHDTDRR